MRDAEVLLIYLAHTPLPDLNELRPKRDPGGEAWHRVHSWKFKDSLTHSKDPWELRGPLLKVDEFSKEFTA